MQVATRRPMTISRLRMEENIVARSSGVWCAGPGSRGEDRLRGRTVPPQLLLQCLRRCEPLDVADPLDPLQPDGLAVQISFEPEQIDLEGPAAVPEGRPPALVHHS